MCLDLNTNAKCNRFENIKIQNCRSYGVYDNGGANFFRNMLVGNSWGSTSQTGILANKSGSKFFNLNLFNNAGSGFSVSTTAPNQVVVGITSNNNGYKGASLSSNSHILLNGTAVNNGENGFAKNASSANSSFGNLAAINNGINGFYTYGNDYATVNNLVSAKNNNRSAYVYDAHYNYFTGTLKLGNTGASSPNTCYVFTSTSPGLTDTTCAIDGSSDASVSVADHNIAGAFIGKVDSDTANTADSSGTADYDTGLLGTYFWTAFDNFFRAWGAGGGAFPNSDNRTRCIAGGTCQIWDWSLSSANAVLLGISASVPTGDDYLVHQWEAVDQTACENSYGGTWGASVCSYPGYLTEGACTGAGGDWASNKCYTKYLKNAYEAWGDLIGDDDLLCESGETCVFSPNAGAYQGHGNLISAGSFIAGALTGITLLKYETNGQ